LGQIGNPDNNELITTVSQISSIKKSLNNLNQNFTQLSNIPEYFTKNQAVFYKALKKLVGTMKNSQIVNPKIGFSDNLWNLLDFGRHLKDSVNEFSFDAQENLPLLKKRIIKLKKICTKILLPKTWLERFRNYKDSTLGTLDQLRCEFERMYLCKRHWLITKDLVQ
jgi:hypothetical protein